jgi:thiol-disulfide isomerase/thioredoxin
MFTRKMFTALVVTSMVLILSTGGDTVCGCAGGWDQNADSRPDRAGGRTQGAGAQGASAGGAVEKPFPLMVGDAPPPLSVGEWLRGDPVEEFEEGHIYVIDLWATWCAQCTQAIPHISALQDQYADQVTVIGVNTLEYLPVRLPDYLLKMEENITYSMVRDEVSEGAQAIEGKMAKAWLQASGHEDIPLSFIIDRDTRIAWIGYSLDMIDPLAAIVEGTWDREAFADEYLRQMQSVAAAAPVKRDLETAFEDKDWRRAFSACGELLAIDENRFAPEAAVELNRIASLIASSPSPSEDDLNVALNAARQANELTGWKRVFTVSTMAAVHFKRGNIERAIDLLQKAIELGDASEKRHLEKTLEQYKEALER